MSITVAVAVALISLGAGFGFGTTGETAASQASAGRGPMNVILVVTDDQPYELLKTMPYVASQDNWVEFTNAYYNYPLCCPSRATILSGLYSHHTRVERNRQADNFKERRNLPTWFDRAGYRTGLYGKYFNSYPWDQGNRYVPPHWDKWFAFLGKARYYNETINANGRLLRIGDDPKDHAMGLLNDRAVRFVGKAKKPFFLYYAPPAPHSPYTPEPKYRGRYSDSPVELPPNFNEADISDKPSWVHDLRARDDDGYAAMLTERWRRQQEMLLSVDEAMRRFDRKLVRRGIYEDTIVVFMSDNGLSPGSHRFGGKVCPYEECLHAPLLIRYPESIPQTVDALVSNVDIAPTLTDIAGVDLPTPIDGRSLRPLMEKERSDLGRDILLRQATSANRTLWGIRTERYKYIEYSETGEAELYDLRHDPHELENVAGSPAHAAVQEDLSARLAQMIEAQPEYVD